MRRLLMFLAAICLTAADHPPPDANERDAPVPFTLAWARHLRGFHRLADLQSAAEARGYAWEQRGDNGETWTLYEWLSRPPRLRGAGYMLARIRPDGYITVNIATIESKAVYADNRGAFICHFCSPPIDIKPPGANPAQ